MYAPVEKNLETKSQKKENGDSQRQNSNAPTSGFVDNRPEAIQMRRLRDLAKNSPQNAKLRELHHLAATHSVTQKKSNVKQGFGFVDNRCPEVKIQRELNDIVQNSPNVSQSRTKTIDQEQTKIDKATYFKDSPIQRVARNNPWTVEKAKYQSNTVGSKRLPGDALWLAMARYALKVPDSVKGTKTVADVLEYARVHFKGVSFDDWKGTQSTQTSNEAQHLVNASYATQVLKWPYEWINSPENGKMLMAGRSGKGVGMTSQYLNAKSAKHKTAARGALHIGGGHGFGHPLYSGMAQKYAETIYGKYGLKIGSPIQWNVALEIMNGLRLWHKQFDRNPTILSSGLSVDQLSVSHGIVTHPGHSSPTSVITVEAHLIHKDDDDDYYINVQNPQAGTWNGGELVTITGSPGAAGGIMKVSGNYLPEKVGGGWWRIYLED